MTNQAVGLLVAIVFLIFVLIALGLWPLIIVGGLMLQAVGDHKPSKR